MYLAREAQARIESKIDVEAYIQNLRYALDHGARIEKRLCTCCMEEHEVKTVVVQEKSAFKGVQVAYPAEYLYCENAEEFFADEEQISKNDIRLKNAYRAQMGLLTSDEIAGIRKKYGITQIDMCTLLGWGAKTITRYESHQVQDKAHDTILRKIDQDPEWFLDLLDAARESFSEEAYLKYREAAADLYEMEQDKYLRKTIEADYARLTENESLQGGTKLSLDKVVDVIRYFAASPRITNLYKVKLMKLMWYADALSYKIRNFAITGLAYQALPMGAVPIGHNYLIDLQGVPCEEVEWDENVGYHFSLDKETSFPTLSDADKAVLDTVIAKLGKMTRNEIVEFMHNEEAYKQTEPREIISFEYAESLQI